MENPTDQIERHLSRASGSAVLAFAAATVAYTFKGAHWILDAYELRAAALDNIIGVINWMGGPMDVGFYTFLASEGIQSMVFATLERNEWRRRVEEERAEKEAARAESEVARAEKEAAKEAARAEREAARAEREAAERRIRELEKRLEDYERRNGS